MKESAGQMPRGEGIVLRVFVFATCAFWGVFAAINPVTNSDSQIYNLARLKLALAGGLYGNPFWNDDRQIYFPWTFDAVHLPFVQLGFGASLPSFACFLGLLLILFRMVESHAGRREAWWVCAAVMALPTLVFEATSTKNDVALVFGMACWLYALDRHAVSGRSRYIWLAALALGFASGAKSTGLPFAAIGAVVSFWILRRSASGLALFAGALALALLTMGSSEIYANNWIRCGDLLGPRPFVAKHVNRQPLLGTEANLIRYLVGNFTIGIDHFHAGEKLLEAQVRACQSALHAMGCRNSGYGMWFRDNTFYLDKSDREDSSDFGLLGGIALWYALFAAVRVRPRNLVWRLSAASAACLLVICGIVGWMPWNERFLMLPALLGTAALVIAILRSSGSVARGVLFAAILASAVVFSVHSPFKNPAGIAAALRDRDEFETREFRPALEIVQDIKRRVASGEIRDLDLSAGRGAWILSFFQIPGLSIHPNPGLVWPDATSGAPLPQFLLVLNRKLPPRLPVDLVELKSYREPDCALYRVRSP